MASIAGNPSFVAFHQSKGVANLIILAQYSPRSQETQTKLIFHKYGDQYVLATAELPNTNFGRTFRTDNVTHVIKVGATVAGLKPEIVEIRGK
jgi:hypothetical protein